MNSNDKEVNTTMQQETVREKLRINTLQERAEKQRTTQFDNALKIERGGDAIMIPDIVRPEKAVEAVKTWAKAEQQIVSVAEFIDGIPVDAAHALMEAVKHEFGVVRLDQSFWGPPPPFFSVPTDAEGNTTQVYVGSFSLPGFEDAQFHTRPDDENLRLLVGGSCRQKDLPLLRQILATAREMLKTQSLYKGKALTIDFGDPDRDDQGNQDMVIPKFWDVSEDKPLILSRETEAMIDATIWTPIRKREAVKAMGTPIKRGVLLYGTFGTGKTLTAYRTAREAVKNGFTFLYVKNVGHLEKAITFASAHYLPAVIFMEDTEKAFENPDRINEIQNTMDGIDGKSRDLIVVLTTNHVDQLPPAIMRPGRLDTIIHLPPADPETASRLAVFYAGEKLAKDSDMEAIGKAVAGNIPAAIREVVERAKLFAISRAEGKDFTINHEDIMLSARSMEEHMRLLAGNRVQHESPIAVFGTAIGGPIAQAVREGMAATASGSAFSTEERVAKVKLAG